MVSLGVASFGHLGGIHYQNLTHIDQYCTAIEKGESTVRRALMTTDEERFLRELILQWKLGRVRPSYFKEKFGVDLSDRYGEILKQWKEEGDLVVSGEELSLTREALLRVDSMLHQLFLPQHRDARYV